MHGAVAPAGRAASRARSAERERRGGLLDEPLLAGQRDQTLRQPLARRRLLPQPHGRVRRLDRPVQLVDVVQRPRVLVEQRGALVGAQQVAAAAPARSRRRPAGARPPNEPPARPPARRRRPRRRRPPATAWCRIRNEVGVARGRAAPRSTSRVELPAGRWRAASSTTARRASSCRNADRVAPTSSTPARSASAIGREVVEQRAQQRQLHPGRHDGELVQARLRVRAQPAHPGQHGVDDGGRHRLPGRGERLGDVERVAVGQPVQRLGIDVRARGERRSPRPGSAAAAPGAAPAARSARRGHRAGGAPGRARRRGR